MKKLMCLLTVCALLLTAAAAAPALPAVSAPASAAEAPAGTEAAPAAPAAVPMAELAALQSVSDGMTLQAQPISGKCGDNVSWSYSNSNGCLTIYGSGPMYDYPNNADKAPEYLRNYCNKITRIVFTGSITAIGQYTFWSCAALQRVDIPNTVQSIGDGAFFGDNRLETINIPASVTSIGDSAFGSCKSLKTITVEEGNTAYLAENNILFDHDKQELLACPSGHQGTYTVPNTVTAIRSWAFYNCAGLTAVTLPPSVKSLGSYAFRETGLTEITLPEGLTELGEGAFYGCNKLRTAQVPAGITQAEKFLFESCTSLQEVKLPDTMTALGDNAFRFCWNLPTLTLPAGLKTIGEFAFEGCTALHLLTLPEGIEVIGNLAFKDCADQTFNIHGYGRYLPTASNDYYCLVAPTAGAASIAIHDDTKMIADYACRSSALTSVTIPEGVERMGAGVFYLSEKLQTVSVLGSVPEIGAHCFRECKELSSVGLSEGLKAIGAYGFYMCPELVSMNLPYTLETIGDWAYATDAKLIAVTLPPSVKSLGSYAFWETGLTEITVPGGVGQISEGVFYCCTALETVRLSEGITSTGRFSFQGCTALETLYVPATLKEVASQSFHLDTALTDVYYADFYQEKWDAISIGSFNDPLKDATLHLMELLKYEVPVDGNVYIALFENDRLLKCRVFSKQTAGTVLKFDFRADADGREIKYFVLNENLAPVLPLN